MTHATALMEIQNALDDLARGTGTVQALSDRARGQQALLQALPARCCNDTPSKSRGSLLRCGSK